MTHLKTLQFVVTDDTLFGAVFDSFGHGRYSKLTFPMPTLNFRDLHSSQVYIASEFVKSLACHALTNTVDATYLGLRGIDTLFEILDQTQIETLELSGSRLRDQE
ncbi:hypothetical protein AC1031_013761 [Aphanomyces cochlioides]|nr:hypothetical protein AC1031_013761 [Aphanomyces cochlioides]